VWSPRLWMCLSRSCWHLWSTSSALRTTTSGELPRARHTSSTSWMLAVRRSRTAVLSISAISSGRLWSCSSCRVGGMRPRSFPFCRPSGACLRQPAAGRRGATQSGTTRTKVR
jgi:hypothetical protein